MLVKMQWKEKNASTFTKYIHICTMKTFFQFFQMLKLQCEFFFLRWLQVASAECSFLKFKFIKNELRNCMTQPCLNNLSLMCIESDILENIDFNDIIHDFATLRCTKTPM
jgi:hypothetical protein